MILFATKDVVTIAPQAFVVFAVVCVAWFFAVKLLSRKVDEAVKRRQNEVAAEASSPVISQETAKVSPAT